MSNGAGYKRKDNIKASSRQESIGRKRACRVPGKGDVMRSDDHTGRRAWSLYSGLGTLPPSSRFSHIDLGPYLLARALGIYYFQLAAWLVLY